ncbi:putative ethylene-responsive transcription factor-like [Capsicum annuum]|nr:putative ethylene-responsive transcription factor-like [Capsicum annuum]
MFNHLQRLPILFFLLFSFSLSESNNESDTPISRFQQYLRINTAHPNPNYTPAINYLTNFANSIPNLHSKVIHLTPTNPLLLLTWPGSNPSLPSILFNSHLDSVPAEPDKWTHPPFSAHMTSDGKIFARGAQDDKCIGMQYLEAIKVIQSSDPDFVPLRNVHVVYVPDEEVGGFDGMEKFVELKEFEELNVGFMMDEGQASTNDEFRVFYADRTPWHMVIKAVGTPGHGSKLYDNTAMENLMKSIEVITKFRESKFDIVKAGLAANSEVISVNPVFLKAGTPSPTGFVMNMQPSEAEAGFDIRMPPTTDPQLMRKIIEEQWAPSWRNMTYEVLDRLVTEIGQGVFLLLSCCLVVLLSSKVDLTLHYEFLLYQHVGEMVHYVPISIYSFMNGVVINVGGEIKKSFIKKPRRVDSNHELQSFPRFLHNFKFMNQVKLHPKEVKASRTIGSHQVYNTICTWERAFAGKSHSRVEWDSCPPFAAKPVVGPNKY